MARANGQGTLVLRGKYYMAKWTVDGKTYTRTTKCTSRREAEKKLAEFTKPFQEKREIEVLENLAAKVRVAETSVSSSKDSKPIELKFIVDTYKNDLATSDLAPNTEGQYNSTVKALVDFIDKRYVYEVTNEDAKSFMTHCKEHLKPSTFNYYLCILKMLFNVAKKHDYRIRQNVWDNFSKLKTNKSSPRRELTDDEVKSLCEEADKIDKDGVGLLFLLGASTGLRKSDCCLLKWANVDLKEKVLRVLPKKTKRNGKVAIVPLSEKLAERLSTLKRDSEYVIPNMAEAYQTHDVEDLITQVFANAKVDKTCKDQNGRNRTVTGFHALRHWFISNCIRQGIPVNVVQQMVAHSSATMSLSYSHVQTSDLQLPDFDDEFVKVKLKKTTLEKIDKARGIHDIDDFLLNLLKGDTNMKEKTKSDIELDEALDEIFAQK